MREETQIMDDSIDLIKIMQLIWHGKWKIIGITIAAILVSVCYILIQPPKSFISSTEVRPISSFDEQKYSLLNNFIEQVEDESNKDRFANLSEEVVFNPLNQLEFSEINSESLENLYIEQLEQKVIFEEAIIEHQMLDRNLYQNDSEFREAVVKMAARININEPTFLEGKNKRADGLKFWEIEFNHTDNVKWKKILKSIHIKANDNIRNILQDRFNRAISIANNELQFQINDNLLSIENALTDYEIKTNYLLSFLGEQAEIARKLGIVKGNTEIIYNTETIDEIPKYLMGFEAIEKEIELINARKDKKAFVDGLLDLENKVRMLEQDKTVERAVSYYNRTPIENKEDFNAAYLLIDATKFNYENNNYMIILLSAVFGGFIGIFYIIVSNAFREREGRL